VGNPVAKTKDSRFLTLGEREDIRVRFFNEFRREGLISVSVPGALQPWLKVEAEPGSEIPPIYEGLEVYVHFTENRWVNAVLPQ
jgi:hypothetical protein